MVTQQGTLQSGLPLLLLLVLPAMVPQPWASPYSPARGCCQGATVMMTQWGSHHLQAHLLLAGRAPPHSLCNCQLTPLLLLLLHCLCNRRQSARAGSAYCGVDLWQAHTSTAGTHTHRSLSSTTLMVCEVMSHFVASRVCNAQVCSAACRLQHNSSWCCGAPCCESHTLVSAEDVTCWVGAGKSPQAQASCQLTLGMAWKQMKGMAGQQQCAKQRQRAMPH